ncbi:reverse transcriptase domain-containing protein [Tanacetum coccineum]
MADKRTYGRIAPGSHEGFEGKQLLFLKSIAANFEIKHGLLTLEYPNVPTTSIKLMLFPFSLEGAARIWLEKEPPRSIQTWDDLVAKFINQFFPPSKTTNLRNEITNFKQRFDESFSEAWDRFKDLLRACPHHGFSELHQLDTFYNALNVNDQDSLNSAAGGNFLDKRPADCSSIIESKSKVRHSRSKAIVAKVSTSASTSGVSPDVAELKDMVRALLLDKQTSPVPAPAPVKAVEQSCVTCGGAHSYRNCPATDSNNYRDNIQEYVSQAAAANFNQGNSGYRPPPMANQIRPPGFPPIQHNSQANNQNRWNQNQNRRNGYNQGQIQRPQVQQQAPMYQPPVNQHPAYQAPAHQASEPKVLDKMLLMQAQENGVVLDEEQLLFIAGGQTNTFDDDVDEAPVQDLALNKDNVFQADQCDAFDSDVDEAPTSQTMFMENLSSADIIYDEACPSYDLDILSEVQDHDNYLDSVDEYQEVHEMHNDVQQNYVVDSDAEYTSNSNIISYDQYVKNNVEQVVQSNVPSVPNDALMMIINDMHDQTTECVSANEQNKVVNESLTAELVRYKEQVSIYEKRASAMQVQSALYNNHEIVKTNHAPAVVHDSEDTLEIAEKTRKKMLEKMKSPLCVEKRVKIAPPDYSK